MKPSIRLGARSSSNQPRLPHLRFRKRGALQNSRVKQQWTTSLNTKNAPFNDIQLNGGQVQREYVDPPPRARHHASDDQPPRLHSLDHRNRLSRFWTPTGRLTEHNERTSNELTASLLARAGFVQPTHAGIFQLLPLGHRVQSKLEALLDKHMTQLGASKMSLSTFSSEILWERSGRLKGDIAELFKLEDRRGTKFLLSPTHEEEVTALVSGLVTSYRTLPLRLYQITRKYRDERRARGGLLRTREFLMKDLYTFDVDQASALETYDSVCAAYSAFFDELKIPYHVAKAHTGSIGGDMSHEYHIISPMGEDDLVTCSKCSFTANTEVLPKSTTPKTCPECHATSLSTNKAIELGHAFNLGTKYSDPLNATIDNQDGMRVPMQMGCFGIGVSRMIAGIADLLRDSRGLNWPRLVAPFDAVVIPVSDQLDKIAELAYDKLCHLTMGKSTRCDPILDDRDVPLVWKLKDADLIGYPIVIIIGKEWTRNRQLEVQCRRLDTTLKVSMGRMKGEVGRLLGQL
jgi:prolyl-tRNA synthetase